MTITERQQIADANARREKSERAKDSQIWFLQWGSTLAQRGGSAAAAVDEKCSDADGQQPQSRGFRHGLEGQSCNIIEPGGKGAFNSVRREFIDVARDARKAIIRVKQIARAVKGQSIR